MIFDVKSGENEDQKGGLKNANDFNLLRNHDPDVFNDVDRHKAPHIHADYQGQAAVYSITDGSVLAGELPPAKNKLVVAWIEIHKDDLLADWELAVNGQNPLPIRGLDQ